MQKEGVICKDNSNASESNYIVGHKKEDEHSNKERNDGNEEVIQEGETREGMQVEDECIVCGMDDVKEKDGSDKGKEHDSDAEERQQMI